MSARWKQRLATPPSGKQHRPIKKGRWHLVTLSRRFWYTFPLSKRLVFITSGLLSVGLVISSLAVTSLLYDHLLSQVDNQLRSTASAIGSQGLKQIHMGSDSSLMPSNYYVEAQYNDGTNIPMVSADTAAKNGIPHTPTLSVDDVLSRRPQEVFTLDSQLIGRPWRAIALPFTDGDTGEVKGVVIIALPLASVNETVARTRLIVALVDVVVILFGAMAAAYLVSRSFRPLRQIEGVAGRIARGDLSARVPVTEPSSTEVGSLQRALNTMLQQNERAFAVQVVAQERMTRFVSDASHELRTPLAAIRGYGELYRMGGVPAERQSEVMGRIETEASRMGRLVEDLLQLARMDEGREFTLSQVNITEVARGALSDMAVLAPDRDCSLIVWPVSSLSDGERASVPEQPEPGPLWVMADRDRLSQVITNLLGNVTRHTPAGSPVEVAVGVRMAAAAGGAGATGGTEASTQAGEVQTGAPLAVVEVIDHGPGIPAKDAERVFERFYRADTSRNRETGGSGLGLSIVHAIVERHGGSVEILQTPDGGATVHIEIPALPAPSPAGDEAAQA